VRLTPGFGSLLEGADTPSAVLLCPAVTTSRRELPGAAVPPIRRPLPLIALGMLAPTFSLVLDASDLESSGWARGREGGIVQKEFDLQIDQYLSPERLQDRDQIGKAVVASSVPGHKRHHCSLSRPSRKNALRRYV
jgi:hypothetical protein